MVKGFIVMSEDIYKDAIKLYGVPGQAIKFIQELNELAVALSHYYLDGRNNEDYLNSVQEEIADVEILCSQFRSNLGDAVIDTFKAAKLDRLRSRIEVVRQASERR